MIDKAIIFATKAHEGQFRKGGKTPYILHPLEAGIITSQLTADEEFITAAILHDVLEDTDATFAELLSEFGHRVAELVEGESEDKTKTWKERKSATLDKLKITEDQDELILVLADKLSNMRAVDRDYKDVGEALWQRFNEKDKDKHGWYYKGIVEGLVQLQGTEPYDEFVRLVEAVFG